MKTLLLLSLLLLPVAAQEKPKTELQAKPATFELSAEGKKSWEQLVKDDQAAQQLERDIQSAQERLRLLRENIQLRAKLLQAEEQAKTCGDCLLTGEGKLTKPVPASGNK